MLKKAPGLDSQFQEYDLGSGRAVSIREFVETVGRLTVADTNFVFGAKSYRKHELMHSEANISKLGKFGWKPKYDLRAGLKKMIEFETREMT